MRTRTWIAYILVTCLSMAGCQSVEENISNDDSVQNIDTDINVDTTISILNSSVDRFIHIINSKNVRSIHSIFSGEIEVVEFAISGESKVKNKFIKDIKLPKSVLILFITRDNKVLIPSGSLQLQEHDIFVCIGTRDSIKSLQGIF